MIVETGSGRLAGVYERGVHAFKGVPYAEPPVGELRWLPPKPPRPWPGVRSASAFGPIAPQPVVPLFGAAAAPEIQNEGCLYLNIFTPGLDHARRPVMVWIHGGAFSMGSGSQPPYSTGTLARNQDIVLVTINYRLGALGFLNLNEVTRGRIPSTGNEGIQDQVMALKWVRENIASFGGDPDNVTVFGESAGAMSIGCLLALPDAEGLFHRAILESPVGEMARPKDFSVKITEEFLNLVGVRADDIQGLKRLPVERLLAAQQKTAAKTRQGAAPFVPVADGVVLPRLPLKALESGQGRRVPTLIGSNLDEDKFFAIMNRVGNVDEAMLRKTASKYVVAEDVPRLLEAYRTVRENSGESTAPFDLYSAINTYFMFRQTAIRIAEAQCQHGPGGYNYLFTWKSPAAGGILGACHALEVGFVFGQYDDTFCGSGPEADRLSHSIQDAWGSFARAGDPSCPSLGVWPKYSEGRATMVLGRNSRVERALYEPERQIWESLRQLPFSNMP